MQSTLYQQQVLSQLSQLQLMHLWSPSLPRVASRHHQEAFLMLLTSHVQQALSVLQAACTASELTQVRVYAVFLLFSSFRFFGIFILVHCCM